VPPPPKKMQGKPKFRILRTVYRIRVNNFGASVNNLIKLAHIVCRVAGMNFDFSQRFEQTLVKFFARVD